MAAKRYSQMDRADLEARLEAAEKVCLFYGWSPSHDGSDPEKATYMAWTAWFALVPDGELAPKPTLNREIKRLAAARDALHTQTLASYANV